MDGQKGVKVYLLNAENANPIVGDASIYLLLKSKGLETNFYCGLEKDYFECRISHPERREAGDEIIIKAKRKGKVNHFSFRFPLDP